MTVRAINTSFVNVYELDRHYGGPEEGGWWFTSGTVVKSLVVPTIEVNDYAALLEELFPWEWPRLLRIGHVRRWRLHRLHRGRTGQRLARRVPPLRVRESNT